MKKNPYKMYFFSITLIILSISLISVIQISSFQNNSVDSTEKTSAESLSEESGTEPAPVEAEEFSNENVEPNTCTGPYPEVYADKPDGSVVASKIIYLTFDDGPSEQTEKVLNILSEKNVKATFFVIGRDDEKSKNIMKRIVNEGHTIAIHTYTHNYEEIYSSLDSYLNDFNKIFKLIYDVTGEKANIFRFPGGSVNSYNGGISTKISEEMLRRGFLFYDWNISCGDCTSTYSVDSCIKNVLDNTPDKNRAIVLMHDSATKNYTVQALPKIIDGLGNQGFTFDKITNKVKPITF